MTRRLVPVLFVALVVLSGCASTGTGTTAPTSDVADAPATDRTTTTTDASTTDDDAATSTDDAVNASSEDAAARSPPPGVDPSNETDALANASALTDAHADALLADGFRARIHTHSDYGQGGMNATGTVAVGPGGDRLNLSADVVRGNRTVVRDIWRNDTGAVARTVVDGRTNYRNAGGAIYMEGLTGASVLSSTPGDLNYSVANVTERDGTTVYVLEASENRDANASVDARLVVDATGVVHSYRFHSSMRNTSTTQAWRLVERDVTPQRPAWTDDASPAARLNVSVDADVDYDRYPNPEGTGYVTEHAVLTVSNDGPDALPAGTNVSITSNGTTYTATLDDALPADATAYLARVDGDLVAADTADAFDDPPNFARNVSVEVAANGTTFVSYSSSYSYGSSREDADDERSPNATTYAPGVTTDGVVYVERLLDAHTEAVVASGFEVTGTETVAYGPNASALTTDREHVTVLASADRIDVVERTRDEDGRVVESWKDGRYRYEHVETDDGAFYRPREHIDSAGSLATAISMHQALEVGDYEVTEVDERADGTFVTLEATSGNVSHNWTRVTSFHSTVVVDDDGRIHSFQVNATYVDPDDGSVRREHATFELVRTGDVDPTRPAWVDDVPSSADDDVDVYPDVENRSRVTLRAYGSEPVPAGTRVVVSVDGDRYAATLDAPIEPRAERYAYVADGDLHLTEDRAAADGRRLVEPTHVRLVTSANVVLVDMEPYLPETNATGTGG